LERDGFTVEDGRSRKSIAEELDLPRADDEVHAPLDRYGFAVQGPFGSGHLQRMRAGDRAAANAQFRPFQFRPFIESLFDGTAEHLANVAGLPPEGHQRRQ
jgi:hypothetical protein